MGAFYSFVWSPLFPFFFVMIPSNFWQPVQCVFLFGKKVFFRPYSFSLQFLTFSIFLTCGVRVSASYPFPRVPYPSGPSHPVEIFHTHLTFSLLIEDSHSYPPRGRISHPTHPTPSSPPPPLSVGSSPLRTGFFYFFCP